MQWILGRFLISALLLLSLSAGVSAQVQGAPQERVNFKTEVWPIFRDRCVECHGPEKQSGGLRLDVRKEALLGGFSGGSVLTDNLEDNELLYRVTSSDEDFRMPRFGAALTEAEIGTIGRWLTQGAIWDDDDGSVKGTVPDEKNVPIAVQLVRPLELVEMVLIHHPYVLILLLVLGLLSSRGRKTLAAKKKSNPSYRNPALRLVAFVRPSHLVIGALITTVLALREDHEELQTRIVNIAATQGIEHKHIFGSPPKPFRPDQEVGLSSTYFRGNCERQLNLYNGGNYRTATLHLRLCDAKRKPVSLGDLVPEDGYVLELIIEKAPHATEGMFSDRMMDGVFLTETHYPDRVMSVAADTVTLDVLEPGERWAAYYPIDADASLEKETGLVYLYINLRTDSKPFRPIVHYGLSYGLVFEEGRLAQGSDVWLGNLFWTPRLQVPRPGGVPINEWFDIKPIPKIPESRIIEVPASEEPVVEPPAPGAKPALPHPFG